MPAQPKPKLYDPGAPENRYPKMVYPDDPPKPGTGKIVNSKDEHDALLAASAPKIEDAPTPPADDKDELLAQAEELGLKLDKRSGIEKIKAAIADAKKSD